MIPKEAMGKRPIRLPELQLHRTDTALLVIDMQYEDAHPDYGVCKRMRVRDEQGILEYYTARLELITANIQKLIASFRQHKMEVIYTHVESLTRDGRDRSLEHKQLNIHVPPGSKEAQILTELEPGADEIVLNKTCGGVFNGTMLDYVLRNIGIQNLVVVGVVTGGCVENTVRDAADRSYSVILVEDCTATWTHEKHAAAIAAMTETFAKVKNTIEVLEMVKHL